ERAPSDFVNASNEGPDRFPKLTLDRLPPISSHRSGLGARQLLVRGSRLGHGDPRLLLADARGLAGEVAQVVELGAANASATHDRNLGEPRAVHRGTERA